MCARAWGGAGPGWGWGLRKSHSRVCGLPSENSLTTGSGGGAVARAPFIQAGAGATPGEVGRKNSTVGVGGARIRERNPSSVTSCMSPTLRASVAVRPRGAEQTVKGSGSEAGFLGLSPRLATFLLLTSACLLLASGHPVGSPTWSTLLRLHRRIVQKAGHRARASCHFTHKMEIPVLPSPEMKAELR